MKITRPIQYQLLLIFQNLNLKKSTIAILLFQLLLHDSPAQICTFDSTTQSWSLAGDANGLTYLSSGGNPGGCIRAHDMGQGLIWYFVAPNEFHGNKLNSYGKHLKFDFKTTWYINLGFADDIILEGNGDTIYHSLTSTPSTNWQHYDFLLDISGGWKRYDGNPVSITYMRNILSSVSRIWVRGEWDGTPGDLGYLDNFVLEPLVALSSTDTSFCEKHCIDFFDQSINNPTSWQWFFPGADITSSTLQNPSNICYNSYGSFDVTLIACNSSFCDTLILPGFINEYPPFIPTIIQSNDTLLASIGVSYQWWSVDSGLLIGFTSNYYVPTQAGNYYVIVADSIGCIGTSNLITIATPIIKLSCSDTVFCEEQCINFYDISLYHPTSWHWEFPGAVTSTSAMQNPKNICYNNYGSFDVKLIACNVVGCDTLIFINFINEYHAPIATITQSNDTLFAVVSNGVSYQWYNVQNGIISGANNSYYLPVIGGDYFIIVTDSVGCKEASNIIRIMAGGAFITPNPNDGSFTISLSEIAHSDFSFRIIDAIGRTITPFISPKDYNRVNFDIELGVIANGLYIIEIINNHKEYREKFVVH